MERSKLSYKYLIMNGVIHKIKIIEDSRYNFSGVLDTGEKIALQKPLVGYHLCETLEASYSSYIQEKREHIQQLTIYINNFQEQVTNFKKKYGKV